MLLNFLNIIFKYFSIYIYFYLVGRAFDIIVKRYIFRNINSNEILKTKNTIVYPVVGIILTGNILVLFNYFYRINSVYTLILLIVLIIPNFLKIEKITLNSFENLFYYFIIPSILIISSSDISFHFDAGYYHLNHQNWLRESNLIIGMVNIFWPFGISSIFEFLSALLWFEDSLIYLHLFSLRCYI